MVHGWHSNSGIHGYLDREGRGGKVVIHGWSMDGTVTVASTDTYRQRGGPGKVAIHVHGWSMDGTVTEASMDT